MAEFIINLKNWAKGLFYEKDEVDALLDEKSDVGHTHDDRYYTETEMDTKLSLKEDKSNKVTSWSGTLSDTNYPSEKLVKNSLDAKNVTVEKQGTAESGYFATYVVKQDGSQVGSKINIPKDYLVKSASLEVCEQANVPVQGYVVGDKYLDFVINTKDSSGTDEHIYILVTDLIDVYTADEVTLTLVNNEFKIKNGGVDTNQLASNAVTTAKITDANVTRAKLASAVTDELDSKLEVDDIDVDFNTTTGVLTIAVREPAVAQNGN